MKPRLAITMGDVNGVGPEILAKALAHPEVREVAEPICFGSAALLDEMRAAAPGCPKPVVVTEAGLEAGEGAVAVVEAGMTAPAYRPGTLNSEAGRCAVEWLMEAIRWTLEGRIDAIVTCPLNKEGIHRAGYAYAGHTEILAEMTASPDYRMCLFSETMRIVHVSSHLSLHDAIHEVTRERVETSIRVGHEALVRLGLDRRRIAVAGLNPHAGEAGAFGSQESEEIAPAIAACREDGIACTGPYAPDTVFQRMHLGEFDLVVAMHHDQGHGPFKMVALHDGVNVTLGIPIIRTSVDHGTAYDIAGKGIAQETSLLAAIRLAARFAQTHEPRREQTT